jgi:hypothetical protein
LPWGLWKDVNFTTKFPQKVNEGGMVSLKIVKI